MSGTQAGNDAPSVLDRLLGRDRQQAMQREAASRIAAGFGKSLNAHLADILTSMPAFQPDAQQLHAPAAEDGEDEGTVVVTLASDKTGDRCVLRFDFRAIAILTNAMLGADPEQSLETAERAATDFEIELLRLLSQRMAAALAANLGNGASLKVSEAVRAADHEAPEAAKRGCAALDYVIELYGCQGRLSLSLPQTMLAQAAPPKETTGRNRNWDNRFGDAVMRVRIPLTVKIDLPSTTLGAIEGWRCGDVLEFARPGHGTAQIFVGQKRLFEGELGRIGTAYTIRLHGGSDRQDQSAASS